MSPTFSRAPKKDVIEFIQPDGSSVPGMVDVVSETRFAVDGNHPPAGGNKSHHITLVAIL